jgi:TolB-like protein
VRRLSLLPLLLLAPVALAQSAPEASPSTPTANPTPAPLRLVLLPLEADGEMREEAQGLTALIVSRLAESSRLAVSTESDARAVRAAGSCAEGSCDEAQSAPKARYVVTGRLDAFGSRYLLTATLMDAESGRALSRPRVEVVARDALPRAALSVADELLTALVPDPAARATSAAPSGSAPGMGSFLAGVRVNNSVISNLSSFNPGADVEVGFQFHPEWVVFGQLGISYVSSRQEGAQGGLNVLPGLVGLRHYHNIGIPLRPYWGLGVGVQLSFGEFGIFQQTGPLPTVIGFGGLEYLFFEHLGVQVEASTNIAQAVLGLADGGLGSGLNLDLTGGIAWHF